MNQKPTATSTKTGAVAWLARTFVGLVITLLVATKALGWDVNCGAFETVWYGRIEVFRPGHQELEGEDVIFSCNNGRRTNQCKLVIPAMGWIS